jgi:hypothetical protein
MKTGGVLSRVAKLFESRKSQDFRRRARPIVEVLEDRMVPTLFWIGPGTPGSGMNWSNPANWFDSTLGTNHVPQLSDTLGFGGASYAANTSSTDDMPNLEVYNIACDRTFTAEIRLPNNLTVDTYFVDYGTLTIPGPMFGTQNITVKKDFFENGAMTISGPVVFTADHAFDVGSITVASGAFSPPNFVATVDVSGILSIPGNGLSLSASTLINDTSGTTSVGNNGSLHVSGSITNNGSINLLNAIVTSGLGLTNGGTITSFSAGDTLGGNVINSGLITFAEALHVLTITGDFSGLGFLTVRIGNAIGGANDTLRVNGVAHVTRTTLTVNNISGQTPVAGSAWGILFAPGGVDGLFGAVNWPPPAPGGAWFQVQNGNPGISIVA